MFLLVYILHHVGLVILLPFTNLCANNVLWHQARPLPGTSGVAPPPNAARQQGAGTTNPYRSLGNALEQWRAAVDVLGDAEEQEGAGVPPEERGPQGAPEQGGEYEFVLGENAREGDTQALAAATEDQAAAMQGIMQHGG